MSLGDTVQPVFCGNTWDKLSGLDSDSSKVCADCKEGVYNLASINQNDLNRLKTLPKNVRVCVVFESMKLLKTLDKVHLLKVATSILITLMLSEWAVAIDKEKQAEHIIGNCELSYYSPMLIPNESKCVDENKKITTIEAWQKTHPAPYFHSGDIQQPTLKRD